MKPIGRRLRSALRSTAAAAAAAAAVALAAPAMPASAGFKHDLEKLAVKFPRERR